MWRGWIRRPRWTTFFECLPTRTPKSSSLPFTNYPGTDKLPYINIFSIERLSFQVLRVTHPAISAREVDQPATFGSNVISTSGSDKTSSKNKGKDSEAPSCVPPTQAKGLVEIRTQRYEDTLRIKTTIQDQFDCMGKKLCNSDKCNGNGDFACGVCLCHESFFGESCEFKLRVAKTRYN